ncbi:MAG: ParB/RepB/Spo0J family partition protein [Pseudanabaenales cyanobacterium]|nr:ParB/RepB/Spo0J family partition protein [Pseudanabaenales cyanobacterium]
MTTKRRHSFPKMKGIEAFLSSPIEETHNDGNSEQTILIEKIQLPNKQPRRYFAPEKMTQLIESVKEHGILEPILVRPLETGGYELVAGERRYRAALEARLEHVPVSIRELDDKEALQIALIENLHREDLNPIEETEGILQLLELQLGQDRSDIVALLYRMQANAKGKASYNVIGHDGVEQVFRQLSMSWESFTANRLPLLNLPNEVLTSLREGKLAYTKAQAIGRVKNDSIRTKLLSAAVKDDLSLTQIRERIKSLTIEQQQSSNDQILLRRFENVSRRIKKAKVWEDPAKKTAFEELMKKLEALLV